MSPDLAARQVLMSCYLYYGCNCNVLDDAQYDAATRLVAERWSEIDPVRQFQLGSPEKILTTGSHVKLTRYTICAAMAWHHQIVGHYPEPDLSRPRWKYDPTIRCEWRSL